jgi:hypothetical protein
MKGASECGRSMKNTCSFRRTPPINPESGFLERRYLTQPRQSGRYPQQLGHLPHMPCA